MKNIGKIVLAGTAGLAGYFIGFYEMKYKVAKTLVEVYIDKENDSNKMEDSTETKEEEAQASSFSFS